MPVSLVEILDAFADLLTYRTSSQLIGLSIMRLVIARLTITHHGHDKRKRGTGTVVLVRVEEDTKTFEVVR